MAGVRHRVEKRRETRANQLLRRNRRRLYDNARFRMRLAVIEGRPMPARKAWREYGPEFPNELKAVYDPRDIRDDYDGHGFFQLVRRT